MRVCENPCCRDRCCSTVNCTYFNPMAQKLDLVLRVYEIELVQISEKLTLERLIRLRRRNSIRCFVFRRVCFVTFREISEPAILLQTYNTQKLQDSEIPSDTNERSLNVRVTWLELLCLSTKVIRNFMNAQYPTERTTEPYHFRISRLGNKTISLNSKENTNDIVVFVCIFYALLEYYQVYIILKKH